MSKNKLSFAVGNKRLKQSPLWLAISYLLLFGGGNRALRPRQDDKEKR